MRKLRWIPKFGPRLVKALAVIVLLLAVLLLFPFKTTIVPTWTLKVTDESGNPVQEIRVTEHWQHYLLEASGHEELRRVDADGRVSFPERTIRASLLRRLLATLSRFNKSGNEARSEPYASVVVWGSKLHETAVAIYREEQAPQSEIVVHTTP